MYAMKENSFILFLSSDIRQSFHNNYEKAFICGQEHEYVNSVFMSRV